MVRHRTDSPPGDTHHAGHAYRRIDPTMKTSTVRPTREELMNEFDTVVSETESLLKSVGGAGQEQAAALRTMIDERIAAAADRLARLRDDATEQAAAAADATDRYVKDNPWQAVGLGMGAGAVAGLLLGVWIARR